MRQRQLEEEKSRIRALILSICIHGLLFGFIFYSGVKISEKMGSGYTEFTINQAERKGSQTQELVEANSNINVKEEVKSIPAVKKAMKPKPVSAKAIKQTEETQKAKADDIALPQKKVSTEESPAIEQKEDFKPVVAAPIDSEANEAETEEVPTDDFQNDLSALTEEELPAKPEAPTEGNSKQNLQEQNAEYGDPNVVRSHKELSPMPGNRSPAYPNKLQRLGIQDTVVVDYYVLPNGRIRDIRVVKDSSYPEFLQNVVTEVKNWKFNPGKTGYFRHEFVFTLNQPTEVIPERLRRKK